MAHEVRGLPCSGCGVLFEDLDAFDKHLPCQRPTKWKAPKFKEANPTDEPKTREGKFSDAHMGDPGGARWASETTRERVDAGLRTRRIRALTWEAPVEPHKSIWKRFWEWLQN
jgi:hypothetical protein